MTEGDWIELAGDIVVFVALALTATIWVAQHSGTIRREINSTLELLRAVRDGVREWGDKYFDADYSGDNGTRRAHGDYELIMQGRDPASNFRVPTESFVVLVQQPETGLLIERRTIQAANIALERIGPSTSTCSSRPTSSRSTWRRSRTPPCRWRSGSRSPGQLSGYRR
jgi:hypothetical protein